MQDLARPCQGYSDNVMGNVGLDDLISVRDAPVRSRVLECMGRRHVFVVHSSQVGEGGEGTTRVSSAKTDDQAQSWQRELCSHPDCVATVGQKRACHVIYLAQHQLAQRGHEPVPSRLFIRLVYLSAFLVARLR